MSIKWRRNRFREGIPASTLLIGFWQAQRLVIQALWLVLVARVLGPGEFGKFAGLIGLATTLGGISGLGFGLVMFQDTVRDHSVLGDRWRTTMLVTLLSGIALTLGYLIVGPTLTASDAPLMALVAVAIAELIAFPVTSASTFAFAAHERMGWSAALPALMAYTRLAATAAVWALFEHPTMVHIAIAHVMASGTTALFSVAAVAGVLKPPLGRIRLEMRAFREGFGFCSVWAGTSALGALDKAMALRWGGAEVAGLYSVVYRVSAIFAMPIEAMTTSSTPRLFRSFHGGDHERKLVGRLALWALAYSAVAGGILWCAAPLAPRVFGIEFMGAVAAARAMTLFIPLYGLRVLGGNILLARGLKHVQSVFQVVGVIVMVFSGKFLVSEFGLWGCVYTILATEAVLCLMVWTTIIRAKPRIAAPIPHQIMTN
jgi:O-antigen/teichoic acid export membrane protein